MRSGGKRPYLLVAAVLVSALSMIGAGVPAAHAAGVKSVLRVSGPGHVIDEHTTRITITWKTQAGQGIAGAPVRLYNQVKGADGWHFEKTLVTNASGVASIVVRPRYDGSWKATAAAVPGVLAATSNVYKIDNLPPGKPVHLPKGAPRPKRHPPAQPRATGTGAHPVITKIPNDVWKSMVGKTWHSGCPVGRSGLRLLRINYWDYSGYRRRGEIVANKDAIGKMKNALVAMYKGRYPIRSMYREDRWGYSKKLHGANDYASMEAGNTSAFNCRQVVGRPGVLSPHSTGRSLDVNTWENPYRSQQGVFPDRWWMSHSHPRVAWRSSKHAVVKIMRKAGLTWTYGLGDTQHFDVPVNGRPVAPAGCGADPVSCH
ncbi:MAG: M15 family metallopeptidase [Nocardioides sp.]|nr:M15 family metallopeptidase [Nocardioides sp.]